MMRLINYNISEAEKQEIAHHLGQRNGYTLHSTWRTGDEVIFQGREYILYDHVACGLGTLAIITNYDIMLEVEWRDLKGKSSITLGHRHIKHPFKAFTGITWSKCQVDQYNKQVDKINAWQSEMGYIPAQLLNGLNNLFKCFSDRRIEMWDYRATQLTHETRQALNECNDYGEPTQ